MVRQLQQTFSDDVNYSTLLARDSLGEEQIWEFAVLREASFTYALASENVKQCDSPIAQFPLQAHQSGPVIHVSLIFMLIISL